jgi:hypothetical protein
MELPAFLERSRVFDCHPHILAEMLGPSGYKVFETKQAGPVQVRRSDCIPAPWCFSPPSRNDAPNTNNVVDAFTSMNCPRRKG